MVLSMKSITIAIEPPADLNFISVNVYHLERSSVINQYGLLEAAELECVSGWPRLGQMPLCP